MSSLTMLYGKVKTFLHIINTDALLFLVMRLAGVVLSITSIILLCRAITLQHMFETHNFGLMYDMIALGPVRRPPHCWSWSIA